MRAHGGQEMNKSQLELVKSIYITILWKKSFEVVFACGVQSSK